MLRKIPVASLQPGMYVVDVHKSWLEHGLWRQRFPVRDADLIRRLAADGITEVSIDTERGSDLPADPARSASPPSAPPPSAAPPSSAPRPPPLPASVSLGEERRRAARLLAEAQAAMQELIAAAGAGSIGELGRLEPLVGRMIASVRRHPDGLAPLARGKREEAYAAGHAVACAALIVVLASRRGLGEAETEKLVLGALLKDIGEASLDSRLIAKPGRLSGAELALVRGHVEAGLAALTAVSPLPATTEAVILEHHERYDGSGYPGRTAGECISAAGRMAAVVDTYDAMTSLRPYRRALSPVAALRQLYRKGGTLYDPALVASFIHAVGVFPVGTLVRLESGHLAVVEAQHPEEPLKPVVRVVYYPAGRRCVTPVEVDLACRFGNHYGQIVSAEDFAAWGINPRSWQPA